jgi:hypothetical protein
MEEATKVDTARVLVNVPLYPVMVETARVDVTMEDPVSVENKLKF